jgi:hypothetical protein
MQAKWTNLFSTCPASTAPLAGSAKTKKKLPHCYLKSNNRRMSPYPRPEPSVKKVVSCLSASEQAVLDAFDMCQYYGPGRSITRLQRYERAVKLDIQPPPNPLVPVLERKRLGLPALDTATTTSTPSQ